MTLMRLRLKEKIEVDHSGDKTAAVAFAQRLRTAFLVPLTRSS